MNLLIKPLKIRTRRYQRRCILNVFRGKIGEPAKQWNAMRALSKQPVLEVIMPDSNSTSVERACFKCGGHDFNTSNRCRTCEHEYYVAHSELIKQRTAEWKRNHPERVKASDAKARANNREAENARTKAWKVENPEKTKVSNAAYKAANRDAYKVYEHNRRGRKESGGNISADLESKLLKLQRGKCACCGLPLGNDYHMDHIMPLVLGGSNTDDNIQLLRRLCNLKKNAKHPVDFMQLRGFLL